MLEKLLELLGPYLPPQVFFAASVLLAAAYGIPWAWNHVWKAQVIPALHIIRAFMDIYDERVISKGDTILKLRDTATGNQAAILVIQQALVLGLDFTGLAWYRSGPDGDYLRVSPQWRELARCSTEDALDASWLNAIHREDRDRVRRELAEAVRTQSAFDCEYRYRYAGPQGEAVQVRDRACPLIGKDDELLGFLGYVTRV